ncbi:olfactory receptor 14C36-like [Ictidomys tridecemlineatus]|uniref:olfactory receptor 14C36-like n=1 Tax=Ictidomys tridecemlineatus TaxID=43179 RepID=UPI00038BF1CD|nr:olfactory receptor 14C36-like [Ictidomys tridecemlineatus]KAG3265186.1 olfactory receptor 14C36-like [Ictidomys tridecemlineatus]
MYLPRQLEFPANGQCKHGTEFLLLSSPEGWDLSFLYFTVFPMTHLVTLLGNLLIVTVTTADQNLHTPMYFFLRNMSILDMCFISVTVPNACVNSLTGNRAISVPGCATQIFLVIFCASAEYLFLTIMAMDHYVAICQPFQYLLIMNPQFCVHIILASLLSGLLYAGEHTGNTFRLSFCQSNVVHQFFCDVPSLLRLSCSDTTSNQVLLLVSAVLICGSCFTFIAMSYIRIFSTVLKFPTRKSVKAFSICTPHILVFSMFLSYGTAVYLRSSATSDILQDMVFSAFYTMAPPFLNHLIYSLRNEQVKEAVRRLMQR